MLEMRYSTLKGQNSCSIAQGCPLSSWTWCICIDEILHELSQVFDVTAYIDDILLALKDDQDPQEALDLVQQKFRKLGLQLNRDKCKFSKNEEIDFMGITFGKEKSVEMKIAPKVQEKATELINKLKKFQEKKVPSHLIQKFVEMILIPSVNYSIFLDLDSTAEEYNQIDDQITEFCMDLFKCPNKQQMKTFLSAPKQTQGLQLTMPGKYFSDAQIVQKYPDDVTKGYKEYHDCRKAIQKKEVEDFFKSLNPNNDFNIAHHALIQRALLDDEMFDQITKIIFTNQNNQHPLKHDACYKCNLCNQNVKVSNHYLTCSQMISKHMTSHDDIVNRIVHLIYKKYKPKAAVTARELGLDSSNSRPDIVTELDSQHFDVTITIDTQKAYNQKINKYKKLGYGDIIPIVVSPQLQMYPKTIEQMKKYYDMQKLYKDIAYNVIKMEVEKSRMYEEEVKNYLELQHLNIQSKLKVQPVFRKAKPKKKKPGEAQHAEKEDISAVSSKETCQDNLNTDEISDEVRNIEDIINIHIDPEQLDPLMRDNSPECSED
ncbi:RT/endonuclease [Hexamita inflata]|uniref:RT/endonuclease n=1 Tax=Hexamita inflata TaxID=28002 RepID=A0AA86Q9L2_9EUKA|nr:RT/endonuclease [Hexamita inflata]